MMSKGGMWFTALLQMTVVQLISAQITSTATLYPRYKANNLVSNFHSQDFDINGVTNGSATIVDSIVMPMLVTDIVMAVVGLGILFTIYLCVFNCCTCSKFTKRGKIFCGRGCCSVIPKPILQQWERNTIMFGLVVLLCVGGVAIGFMYTVDDAQSETLEKIPNLIGKMVTDLDEGIASEVNTTYTTIRTVALQFEFIANDINAQVAAATADPNTTLVNQTQVKDIAIKLLTVLKIIDQAHANNDTLLYSLAIEAETPVSLIGDSTSKANKLTATLDDVRDLEGDVRDAVDTVEGYRELGFLVVCIVGALFICCSFTVAFSDACCKRWDNHHIRSCTCYDPYDGTDEDENYNCSITSAGCSICGCGRDHCGCSCAVSFTSILVMFGFFVIATLMLTLSTLGASVCTDPFAHLDDLVIPKEDSSNTSAQLTYYVHCHTYETDRLSAEFPLNDAAQDIRENANSISQDVETLFNSLETAGFSQATLTSMSTFNNSIDVELRGMYAPSGVFGYIGTYSCKLINQYVHEGLIYVCDDLYSSIAMLFYYWLAIALVLCLIEVGQKCARREDDDKMSSEFFFENKYKDNKPKKSTIATINPMFGTEEQNELVFFNNDAVQPSNRESRGSFGSFESDKGAPAPPPRNSRSDFDSPPVPSRNKSSRDSVDSVRPSNYPAETEEDRLRKVMEKRQRARSSSTSSENINNNSTTNKKRVGNDISNFKKNKNNTPSAAEPISYGIPTQFPPQAFKTHEHVRDMNVYNSVIEDQIDYDFARLG
eukprot:m.242030 g.242030  ORF g.242030 m.242030 type:complete len:771 (+) comp33786_c0_seq1:192-2504(+)